MSVGTCHANGVDTWRDSVHPQARALLSSFERDGVRPFEELGVLKARQRVAGAVRMQAARRDVASVIDLLVPAGKRRVPVRLYDPDPARPKPLVVYCHGGGFVTGSVAVADRPCRALAVTSGCAIASIEYRLAPENPFPAAADDCEEATTWLVANQQARQTAPAELALFGDSAGGALAATTCERLRFSNVRPRALLLVYPTLAPLAGRESVSACSFESSPALTRGSVDWFWELYLGEGSRAADPRAIPLCQPDLRNFPETVIVAAQFDVLRDDAFLFQERLQEAGIRASLHEFAGAIHGFWWLDAELDQADELTSYLASELQRIFTGLRANVPPAP